MKEIFLGIVSALVFLTVWLAGRNILISAACAVACFGIAYLTIISFEKEKKMKIHLNSDADEYQKIKKSILEHSSRLERYISSLMKMNIDRGITELLKSIHKSCSKILRALEEDHSLHSKLNDFSSYYLPGLINIVDTYENLASGSFRTDEAKKFADQFYTFLNQISDAFERKYDSLFSKDVLDSNAEMAAMTAIFKSEGLVDNKDFMGGLNK